MSENLCLPNSASSAGGGGSGALWLHLSGVWPGARGGVSARDGVRAGLYPTQLATNLRTAALSPQTPRHARGYVLALRLLLAEARRFLPGSAVSRLPGGD